MKQSQNGRRGRSRSGPRKPGKGQDSSRAEIKVRGNPKQLLEKYKNAARDAQQAGDRVLAEHNLQFADHYQRVLNEMRGLTRGLFSGDYVVVEREQTSASEDDVEEGLEAPAQSMVDDAEDAAKPRRPRRPRRTPHTAREDAAEASPAQAAAPATPAPDTNGTDSQDQPTEVHPELDLTAQQSEAAPKPRRPRRPRRTPAAENETVPQESGAA